MRTDLKKPYHFLRRMFEKKLPPDSMNLEHNRAIWTLYAKTWRKKDIRIQNVDVTEDERDSYITDLGDEWGRLSDLEDIISDYIYPYVTDQSLVAEIGVGGGRVARRVAKNVKELWCFDISSEMLGKAEQALRGQSNVKLCLLDEPKLPSELAGTLDFVYSFDTFVHLDLHMMWNYFKEIDRVLKGGGKAFLHTSNLKAPGGWDSFSRQESYSVIRHFFISPEVIDILSERAGFEIIRKSNVDPSNFYLNRDYLFVLEKRRVK